MKQQHTVSNLGDSEIKVKMEDGWHTVGPGESVTGVLHVVNNKPRRTLYRVEPFGSTDEQTLSPKTGETHGS